MKLVKVISRNEIFPLNFPQEIKENGKLEYFVKGEGYKKTKAFDVLEDEVPDKWDASKMNWFQICEFTDKYGLNLGKEYAEAKVAGIIAKQTVSGYYSIYKKIKNILPDNFDQNFFNHMRCDYLMACCGLYSLDVLEMDEIFDAMDEDYNASKCTYKGQKCSMKEYVSIKYGEDYSKLIDACL